VHQSSPWEPIRFADHLLPWFSSGALIEGCVFLKAQPPVCNADDGPGTKIEIFTVAAEVAGMNKADIDKILPTVNLGFTDV
jgi:hypothetical protein